jgi:hypothetical protein
LIVELLRSGRALVQQKGVGGYKKNGVTTVNVECNLDDSTGLLHMRPNNALNDGMTALKQQSSALAIDAESDLDTCFGSSAVFRERPGVTKKRFATSTGSDVGLSRHVCSRVISKSTKSQAEASSISPQGNSSNLQTSWQ